jgi:subtilase family serine protease
MALRPANVLLEALRAAGRRRMLVAVLALVSLGAAFGLARGLAGPHVGGVVTTVARVQVGHPLPAQTTISFDLVLRTREAALTAYVSGLFERGSPDYEHYLTPAEFGARFGLRASALAALQRRLRTLGVSVLGGYPQRTALRVQASAATLRRTLGIEMRSFRTTSGTLYRAPVGAPAPPPTLASWVVAFSGLSTRPIARTNFLPTAAGPAMRPQDVRGAYDLYPLYQSGIEGAGQTIDILSIDGFNPTGFERYSAEMGLSTTPPKIVTLEKADLNDQSGESSLDTEVIHAIAPQAKIIDYQLDFQDLADAINQVVASHNATIVSSSFGACDTTTADPAALALGSGFRKDVNSALLAAAATGMTFVFSTGDNGGYQCYAFDPKDHNVTVEFPSDSPYVLAVGGTVLSINNNEQYAGETAWGDPATTQGGGGGVNPDDAAPSWQSAVAVPSIAHGHRATPDVSAAAGADSSWWTNNGSGSSSGDGWGGSYGTSASAPFWAASLLLVTEFMKKEGVGPLCFATPLLYQVAEQSWKYPPFHDVTSGNNLVYNAVSGWDFATGWGSPDVADLAADTALYRHSHPLPAGSHACAAAPR